MFDKIRQGASQANDLRKLRGQMKDLQKQLAQITVTEEKGGMRVKVSADQKFQYIEIDGEENKDLMDLLNDALKKVQKKAAQEMAQMEGGISGLLKGMK